MQTSPAPAGLVCFGRQARLHPAVKGCLRQYSGFASISARSVEKIVDYFRKPGKELPFFTLSNKIPVLRGGSSSYLSTEIVQNRPLWPQQPRIGVKPQVSGAFHNRQ
jgi:hypothetical protein